MSSGFPTVGKLTLTMAVIMNESVFPVDQNPPGFCVLLSRARQSLPESRTYMLHMLDTVHSNIFAPCRVFINTGLVFSHVYAQAFLQLAFLQLPVNDSSQIVALALMILEQEFLTYVQNDSEKHLNLLVKPQP